MGYQIFSLVMEERALSQYNREVQGTPYVNVGNIQSERRRRRRRSTILEYSIAPDLESASAATSSTLGFDDIQSLAGILFIRVRAPLTASSP